MLPILVSIEIAKVHKFQEEETNQFLAEADDIIVKSQPRLMLDVLGAAMSPMYDAAEGATGMAL